MLLASGAADSDKTGCYIVVLKDGTTHERFMAIKSHLVSMTEDEELHGSVEAVVKAFTVNLSDHALSIVSVVDNTISIVPLANYRKSSKLAIHLVSSSMFSFDDHVTASTCAEKLL